MWTGARRLVQRVIRTETAASIEISRSNDMKSVERRHLAYQRGGYSRFIAMTGRGKGVLDVRDDEEGRELVFIREGRRLLGQTLGFGDHGTR